LYAGGAAQLLTDGQNGAGTGLARRAVGLRRSATRNEDRKTVYPDAHPMPGPAVRP
jgi:hypothetical protein